MARDDRVARLRYRLEQLGLVEVVGRAADEHHVTLEDVLGPRRTASVSAARKAAMVALYVDYGKSMPEVGELLDRDHSTVFAALRSVGVTRRQRPGGHKSMGARSRVA